MIDLGLMKVLILGGTGRARRLASTLGDAGHTPVTSLAGRTRAPLAVAGETLVGGFGGSDGLAAWLGKHRPDAVVDATHPYAAHMSTNAVTACSQAGIPLIRYDVPSWRSLPEAARWSWVPDHASAAAQAARSPVSVLITVGRQPLAHYRALAEHQVLARMVDPPDEAVPPSWRVLAQRGPFSLEDERELLAGPPRIGCLISKDSGGTRLDAKLVAADELGVTVVMIERPILPEPDAVLTDETEVLGWFP